MSRFSSPLAGAALLLLSATALAGRPMLVDDAGVNDPGAAHVEAWWERAPGNARQWTVAPAWSPVAGLELGAALVRNPGQDQSLARLQLKWQIGAAQGAACQQALTLGTRRQRHLPGTTPWLTGILSCAAGPGTLHLNLGASRNLDRWGGNLGVAWEQDLGWATGHAEWLAARGTRPIVNLGLRRDVEPQLQLDGSIGRSGRQTLLSLGLKRQF